MKIFTFGLCGILVSGAACAALPFTGMYQTIDDETNLPKSIVKLYEYKDGNDSLLAGRIVALYDEKGNVSETINNPVKLQKK